MIVEFFGMPGAGKTTVAHRCATSLGSEVISIESKWELLWRNAQLLIRHPIRVPVLFLYVLRNAHDLSSFWYKFTNLFLHTNAKYHKARSRDMSLVDQGYFQNAVSLFDSVQDPDSLRRYLKSAFLPDVLFVFELPPSLQQARLVGRDYIVRSRQGEEAFRERLTVMQANFQSLLEATWPKSVHLTRIDASRSPDAAYMTVITVIDELKSQSS